MVRSLAWFVGLWLLTVAAATAQETAARSASASAEATGIIRGTITAADTGKPIRGADLRVEGGNTPRFEPRWVRTDEYGRYEIKELAAGRYTLTASKVGYLTLGYGQRRSGEGGRPVDVSGAVPLEKIDFALPRGSVIVARVTDHFGDPLRGVSVRAYQYRFQAGERRLQQVSTGFSVTDDRGEQRVFGLPPGDYYLAATPNLTPTSPRSDAETYYPGTVRIEEAQPIQVEIGEEAYVTFPMASAKPARLSGLIVGSNGTPLAGATASLQRIYLGSGSSRRLAIAPDGSFTEEYLPPGTYAIYVQSPEWAIQRVPLFGEDLDNLIVTTKRGASVRARITFDGADPPREPVDIRPAFVGPVCGMLGLSTSCGGGSVGLVPAVTPDDWTFKAELTGVGVLRLQRPAGWWLKAVLLDDEDVTDTPLELASFEGKPVEIVLTKRRSEVRGSVVDDRGDVIRDCVVVLFPEAEEQWTPFSRFIATGRPDQQGSFALTGLPPGRYRMTALEYLAPGEERNPATLARLREDATTFSLSDGESRTIGLRIAR
jgi:hypothetical protein